MALKLDQKKQFGRQSISAVTVGRFDRDLESSLKKPLGLKRAIGTAFAIILGGFMCYASLHYIPAFISPPKVISVVDFSERAEHLKDENTNFFLRAYIDAFNINRAYLKKGQTVEAQYLIPEGNTLTLTIQQCKAIPVIEIFNCSVVADREIEIENSQSGLRAFTFNQDGFYKFGEILEGSLPEIENDKKRYVIWSRR